MRPVSLLRSAASLGLTGVAKVIVIAGRAVNEAANVARGVAPVGSRRSGDDGGSTATAGTAQQAATAVKEKARDTAESGLSVVKEVADASLSVVEDAVEAPDTPADTPADTGADTGAEAPDDAAHRPGGLAEVSLAAENPVVTDRITEPVLERTPPSRVPATHTEEVAAQPARQVVAAVATMSTDELERLYEFETANKRRKSVLTAIEQALTPTVSSDDRPARDRDRRGDAGTAGGSAEDELVYSTETPSS